MLVFLYVKGGTTPITPPRDPPIQFNVPLGNIFLSNGDVAIASEEAFAMQLMSLKVGGMSITRQGLNFLGKGKTVADLRVFIGFESNTGLITICQN